MAKKYYACKYRFADQDAYLLWFTNDQDGVLVDNGQVLSFRMLAHLQGYAAAHAIPIESAVPPFYNLDAVVNWLHHDSDTPIDCELLLMTWNLFRDVATSVHRPFDRNPERTQIVYEKLFYGNNLPSITPTDEYYEPQWAEDEIVLLREIFTDGLQLFTETVKPIEVSTSRRAAG
jgi:hypothetical protein